MSDVFLNSVLRQVVEPVVCEDLGAAKQLPHQEASYCPCFTPGTLIKTNMGEVAVEDLTIGMQVLTRDNGYRSIKWVGHRVLGAKTLERFPELQPIRIGKGALGPDLPERDTVVSPQHRMLLSNGQIKDWFDSDEVLVAAHLLTCFDDVARISVEDVTYIHFMFEQHEIVLADGAWSESYQPGDMRVGAMDEAHREELIKIFPELKDAHGDHFPAARRTLDVDQFTEALSLSA